MKNNEQFPNAPDWATAPEWAKYRAMDADGGWWWYEKNPICYGDSFMPNDGLCERAKKIGDTWRKSVQKRPEQ